eukprot:2032654-Pyramimonas_sp.AAC.1
MQVPTDKNIMRPDGGDIKTVQDAVYLGGLVSCDGRVATELSSRLGTASRTFKQLDTLWTTSSL